MAQKIDASNFRLQKLLADAQLQAQEQSKYNDILEEGEKLIQ